MRAELLSTKSRFLRVVENLCHGKARRAQGAREAALITEIGIAGPAEGSLARAIGIEEHTARAVRTMHKRCLVVDAADGVLTEARALGRGTIESWALPMVDLQIALEPSSRSHASPQKHDCAIIGLVTTAPELR